VATTPVAAQGGMGSITLNIKDLQGNDIAVGSQVRGDLWGVSQPTGGGVYTWHHMNKDAVDVGGVAWVTWTNAEIDAEVDLTNNNFWFAANAWGGNPWANTQVCSSSGLWGTFVKYDPTVAGVSWDVRVVTEDVSPATMTSSGVFYDLDLSGATYLGSWAQVNVTYPGCPHNVQPVISAVTRAYMVGEGYGFSFNDTEGLLTITNASTGFSQTYSAREDGAGGYIQELENLGYGSTSYDAADKQLIVDIDYAALGLDEGDTFFCRVTFRMALADPNYSTYSDLFASATLGVVGHTLDPLWIGKMGSVPTATGSGMASFSTNRGVISDLAAVAAVSPAPRGVTFPHGMFSFEITGLADGETITLTIELPEAVPEGTVWWKHDGTRWYSLPNLRDNGDNIMVIELTDGGLGDMDGVANGVITDPGGAGNPVPPLAVGWEGSSVNKAAVMAPWIVLLATMMAGASLLVRRRRRAQI